MKFATPRVAVVGALLVVAGCVDDGNDVALQQQRAADLAAEFRASQTTEQSPATSVPPVVVTETITATSIVSPPATTLPPVEPTGVVIPVIALDNSFRPQLVEIAVGDEVLWENRGLNEHNVLQVEGEGWGVEVEGFQPGAVFAHVFTEPGEYRYYCSIHGNESVGMVGTVIVTA